MELPLKITPLALKWLKRYHRNMRIKPPEVVRIGIEKEQQSFRYVVGFDTPKAGDLTFEIEGLTIVIAKEHVPYLEGMQLDYHNGLNEQGFIFIPPKSTPPTYRVKG